MPCSRRTGTQPPLVSYLAAFANFLAGALLLFVSPAYPTSTDELSGETNGFCDHTEERIVVSQGSEPAPALKTLFTRPPDVSGLVYVSGASVPKQQVQQEGQQNRCDDRDQDHR